MLYGYATIEGMITILLHSSKTMVPTPPTTTLTEPVFEYDAIRLRRYLAGLTDDQIARTMHISSSLARTVQKLYHDPQTLSSATVETFRGDIYSGLRALDFTPAQKAFAQEHLVILSGMYGLLRPYDAITPYRLEAAYKLPTEPYENLYEFWYDRIARQLPKSGPIINVTSVEYEKLIMPYINKDRVITPKFLSVVKPGSAPKFVAVHAKIARGAYARWLIQRGEDSADGLEAFDDLGYVYDADKSTPQQPVYVCQHFQGIGLSQRLA